MNSGRFLEVGFTILPETASGMKLMKWNWSMIGILLLIVILTFQQQVVPVNAYWYEAAFTGSNDSHLWITGEIDYVEWIVDQNYPIIFSMNLTRLGSNVSRLYDITIECKWVAADIQEELLPMKHFEMAEKYQQIDVTFVFFPTKATLRLNDGETKSGSLQYKLSFKEDIGENNTSQSTDWRQAFDIHVNAPTPPASKNDYEFDPVLIGALIMTIGALGLAVFSTFRGRSKPKPRRRKKILAAWMKTCAICETMNDFDAIFCKRCGSKLEADS
ncbi:MAG: hypothetical protein ACE5OZ_03130 [Candidatus Heimdallarchaeota archaeon]